MKKSFNISLSGIAFNIEEDAYNHLEDYLNSIKSYYASEDGEEILSDIEASLAEKFSDKINPGKQVITLSDVEEIIKVMGTVEEFGQENNLEISEKEEDSEIYSEKGVRRLYRNPDDMVIAGVCSGLAAYFGIETVFVRIIFILLIFFQGIGILAYFIFWLVMPLAKTNVQKLEMRGKPVNIRKLEQAVKEKAVEVAQGGESLVKKNRNKIYRILSFPIDILRQIVLLIKKIFKKTMPLLSILSGLGLGILVIMGAIVASIGFGFLLFNINSPYLVSDIPFRELVDSQYYYFGVVNLYISILLPIIFALFVSIFLVIRKNVFRLKIFVLLTLIWLVAIVGASVSMVNIFSSAKEKIDTQKVRNQVTKELDFNNINKIKIEGEARVRVFAGEDFNFKIIGDKDNVERFEYDNKAGELIVTQKPEEEQYCLFCFDDETEIDIVVPELNSFIASGEIDARIEDLNKDLQI